MSLEKHYKFFTSPLYLKPENSWLVCPKRYGAPCIYKVTSSSISQQNWKINSRSSLCHCVVRVHQSTGKAYALTFFICWPDRKFQSSGLLQNSQFALKKFELWNVLEIPLQQIINREINSMLLAFDLWLFQKKPIFLDLHDQNLEKQ